MLGTQLSKPVRSRAVVRLSIAAGSILLALAIAELFLRRLHPEANGWFIWPPGLDMRFRPEAGLFPGVEGDARFRVDSLGLRGEEVAGATERIVTIGGSTTECLFLDQDESWPELLSTTLSKIEGARVWVGNAGRSGHTTREHIFQVEELVHRIPSLDLALVLPGVNDLCKRLAQDAAYDPKFMSRDRALDVVKRAAFSLHPLAFDANAPLVKRLALWRLASSLRRRFEAGDPHEQDFNGHVFATWRLYRARAREMRDELPDLSSALEEYRTNLGTIIDIATRERLRIAFATQPCLWRADLSPELEGLLSMGGVGDYQAHEGCAYYTPRALAEGMRRYNEVLLEVCRERNVECLDLAALLDHDDAAFYDDCHFTEHGARRVAEAWAARLASSPPARR